VTPRDRIYALPAGEGRIRLVGDDVLGRRLGDVELDPDPFSPATHRDVAWFCRLVGCDPADAWRQVWRAFTQEAAG